MLEPASFEKLRPLGLLEQFSSARHSLGFYRNVAATASYWRPRERLPLKQAIYFALSTVIAHHPVLSAIIVDEDSPAPYFVRLLRIDLQDCVTFIKRKRAYSADDAADSELDEVLEEQHSTDFKKKYGERPFWRLIILTEAESTSQFVASFVFHHALGDGQSGLAFHRTFLSALVDNKDVKISGDVSNDNANWFLDTPTVSLIPSLESLDPLPLSISYIFKALWNSWFPNSSSDLWTALPMTSDVSKRRPRYRSFTASQDITQRILIRSRAHDVTLQATFEVLFAAVMFTHLPSQYTILRGSGAISLRRWLPSDFITENSIGTWISTYSQDHYRSKTSENVNSFSWDEAQAVKRTINAEVSKEGKDIPIGLLRYAGDMRAYFLGKMEKERESSFEVSNLGIFKPTHSSSTGEEWKIGRMVFSQSANVAGPPLVACLVTGGDGRLTVGFSWLEDIVDEEFVKNVMVDLQSGLENLAKEGMK